MDAEIGSVVPGAVLRVTQFGAIVRLNAGGVGLIHISEITDGFVRDVADHFREGDEVNVRVLARNNRGKLEFSTKDVVQPTRRRIVPELSPESMAAADPSADPEASVFEKKLSSFLKESDDRHAELRHNLERKRQANRHRS
jgi:S1 RNA binding domain protein